MANKGSSAVRCRFHVKQRPADRFPSLCDPISLRTAGINRIHSKHVAGLGLAFLIARLFLKKAFFFSFYRSASGGRSLSAFGFAHILQRRSCSLQTEREKQEEQTEAVTLRSCFLLTVYRPRRNSQTRYSSKELSRFPLMLRRPHYNNKGISTS